MPAITVRYRTWLDAIGHRLWCVPTALFMALFLALCGLLSFFDPLA
jgi:hypothetical protein